MGAKGDFEFEGKEMDMPATMTTEEAEEAARKLAAEQAAEGEVVKGVKRSKRSKATVGKPQSR